MSKRKQQIVKYCSKCGTLYIDDATDNKNLTIIDCYKLNVIKNVKILSVIGILFSLFSLIFSFVFYVHILNPFFAILLFVAACGFYIMAKVEDVKKMHYGEREKL